MKWICIISGILLLIAPKSWFMPTIPNAYYEFLRWAIFLSSLIVIRYFYRERTSVMIIIISVIAFLFNPIIPIFLDKGSWGVIDILSASFFFVGANLITQDTKTKKKSTQSDLEQEWVKPFINNLNRNASKEDQE
jgi:Family of unknown function (DUF6804)